MNMCVLTVHYTAMGIAVHLKKPLAVASYAWVCNAFGLSFSSKMSAVKREGIEYDSENL